MAKIIIQKVHGAEWKDINVCAPVGNAAEITETM